MSKEQSICLKVFAIILMIFHHCFGFPDRIPSYFVVNGATKNLALGCRLCVSLFLVISGYGWGKKILQNAISWKYVSKKIVYFYGLYWFTMFITLPLGFIGGGIG